MSEIHRLALTSHPDPLTPSQRAALESVGRQVIADLNSGPAWAVSEVLLSHDEAVQVVAALRALGMGGET